MKGKVLQGIFCLVLLALVSGCSSTRTATRSAPLRGGEQLATFNRSKPGLYGRSFLSTKNVRQVNTQQLAPPAQAVREEMEVPAQPVLLASLSTPQQELPLGQPAVAASDSLTSASELRPQIMSDVAPPSLAAVAANASLLLAQAQPQVTIPQGTRSETTFTDPAGSTTVTTAPSGTGTAVTAQTRLGTEPEWRFSANVSALAAAAVSLNDGGEGPYFRGRADATLEKKNFPVTFGLHAWHEGTGLKDTVEGEARDRVCYDCSPDPVFEYYDYRRREREWEWHGRTLFGLGPSSDSAWYGFEVLGGFWSSDGDPFGEVGAGLGYRFSIFDDRLAFRTIAAATDENAFRGDVIVDYRVTRWLGGTVYGGGRVDYESSTGFGAGADVAVDLPRLLTKYDGGFRFEVLVGAALDKEYWQDSHDKVPKWEPNTPRGARGNGTVLGGRILSHDNSRGADGMLFAGIRAGYSF